MKSRHYLRISVRQPLTVSVKNCRQDTINREWAPIPYLGMIFEGIEILRCHRGYFVVLGFRVRFDLLEQVISPCPKMY